MVIGNSIFDASTSKDANFRHARKSGTKRQWKGIMIHWSAGNGDAPALIRYLDREIQSRKEEIAKGKKRTQHGWYHYVVDENSIWMLGDPEFNRGAHAGSPWNDHYIGVCIAHPIIASAAGKSAVERRGLDCTETKWKGTNCFTLDPKVALETMRLVYHLCRQWNIPFEFRATTEFDVKKPDVAGIICHHHVTNNKWDCKPWVKELKKAAETIAAEATKNEESRE